MVNLISSQCVLYEDIVLVEIPTQATWTLWATYDYVSTADFHLDVMILYHDAENGARFQPGAFGMNKDAATLPETYARLDELENWRLQNGSFVFKLCYPGKQLIMLP